VVMQCARFNEMKDALLDAIDEITKTLFQLKKASEEYYFQDKDQVSWRVSHDVCVDMQEMANSLDKSASRFQQLFDTQTPSDLSFDDPLTMNSNYPTNDLYSEDSDNHYDLLFDDPCDMDTDNEC
jgi:hypothetical protein